MLCLLSVSIRLLFPLPAFRFLPHRLLSLSLSFWKSSYNKMLAYPPHHMLVILSVSCQLTCLTLPSKYCVIVCWSAFINKTNNNKKPQKTLLKATSKRGDDKVQTGAGLYRLVQSYTARSMVQSTQWLAEWSSPKLACRTGPAKCASLDPIPSVLGCYWLKVSKLTDSPLLSL